MLQEVTEGFGRFVIGFLIFSIKEGQMRLPAPQCEASLDKIQTPTLSVRARVFRKADQLTRSQSIEEGKNIISDLNSFMSLL